MNILKVVSIMNYNDHWDTNFFDSSPIIQQLKPFTNMFSQFSNWPTISDYAEIFNTKKLAVKPVPQSHSIFSFSDQYEPRIYLKGELQTRTQNWHDFFNALIWLKFPITKKTLNSLHYHQAKSRIEGSNRSTLENRITQFDECGAIVISNDKYLLEMIRNHQWHELFVDQKERFFTDIECIIFGHAIFEKALEPYIGMTCHCILIDDATLLTDIRNGNHSGLDARIASIWDNTLQKKPEKLHPLPILGVPGYWSVQTKEFYKNKKYFR